MSTMDEDQLLDYEEEAEETTEAAKPENGTATEKKMKVGPFPVFFQRCSLRQVRCTAEIF